MLRSTHKTPKSSFLRADQFVKKPSASTSLCATPPFWSGTTSEPSPPGNGTMGTVGTAGGVGATGFMPAVRPETEESIDLPGRRVSPRVVPGCTGHAGPLPERARCAKERHGDKKNLGSVLLNICAHHQIGPHSCAPRSSIHPSPHIRSEAASVPSVETSPV